jgi:aminopeptidase N
MKDAQPGTVYLKDYRPSDYLIDMTDLHFMLDDQFTTVTSKLTMRRNPAVADFDMSLQLDGQELELISVAVDGNTLSSGDYSVDDEQLIIHTLPEQFVLSIVTRINPSQNTALEGLYRSRTMYCTQCEAQGFRRITFYLDRPDVMSRFTTTIDASAKEFPVLLSNGNNIAAGESGEGRHWVRWEDPFPKPCYLFALVAGDLARVDDSFTTMSGRHIGLQIFVESKDLDKCDHAMNSLKRAMKWDEEVYGREYDLDIFMIVAVDDFNMGAMENKGLNIFNTSCVLAKAETTTDAGFQRVEGIVAHEYFHNWTGNRVTCRDWFQLSLKEGFTVFRDSEYSADIGSRTVKRVEDVTLLRTAQFAEDAGPMSHPIQPASYIEISNFYTLTVYEKGGEVVRMIRQLLGEQGFRAGSDLYFDRHDGQAVTCDDFVQAMADASGKDFSQFKHWYSQSGTPQVKVTASYDDVENTYTLHMIQSSPPTPGQSEKQPYLIPIKMSLLGDAGALPLVLQGAALDTETCDNTEVVLQLTQPRQDFVFENIGECPVPSLLRGFSAPVKLSFPYSRDDLTFLMQNDNDGFSRWDACNELAVQILLEQVERFKAGEELQPDERLLVAYRNLLNDDSLDPAMVALMLTLPSEAYLSELSEVIYPSHIHHARQSLKTFIAQSLHQELLQAYHRNEVVDAYDANSDQIAKRSLRNVCLSYLSLLEDDVVAQLCIEQLNNSDNMTDEMAALVAIVHSPAAVYASLCDEALAAFYQRWQKESLVINQWLQVQATKPASDALGNVYKLIDSDTFEWTNPNKIRAVVGAFCGANAVNFHQVDGAGHQLLCDVVIRLNHKNPQIAARILAPLTRWRQFEPSVSASMNACLQKIFSQESLSKDVYEVVAKSLAD